MRIPIFQIDAFAGRLFQGNPAAVCLLPSRTPGDPARADWPEDALLQAIAAENNLAETAFVLAGSDPTPLRWFTPEIEMDLCGHATLATAAVIFRQPEAARNEVVFSSRSGALRVFRREDGLLALDFPSRPPEACAAPAGLADALGGRPAGYFRSRDLMVVYETEEEIAALRPDFARLTLPGALGVIVTAPGESVDFVSRFFAPGAGVPEDPVTGSAHCTLIPYWAARLGRTTLQARQLSARGGELHCRLNGDRVEIAGQAIPYLEGFIDV